MPNIIKTLGYLLLGIIILGFITYIILKLKVHNFSVLNTTYTTSNIDGERYKVSRSYDDKGRSADVMAELTNRVYKLLKILKKKYLGELSTTNYTIDQQNDNARIKFIKQLLANYRLNRVTEISPHNSDGDTSYVVNKGESFVVCLRDKETGKIHNINDLMFVVLHELTHMGTADYKRDYTVVAENGQRYIVDYDSETDHTHGELFWILFKFLLTEAAQYNILPPKNYFKNQTKYCGITINYNPYYDPNIFSI